MLQIILHNNVNSLNFNILTKGKRLTQDSILRDVIKRMASFDESTHHTSREMSKQR